MNLKEAELAIAEREPFTAGNLSGAIEDDNALMYVVRSYGVKIASTSLFIDDAGVRPDAYGHSKTTSRHANIVKRAWGLA